MSKILFEQSVKGRRGVSLPVMDVPAVDMPTNLKRVKYAEIGEYSELDVIRHYTNLSLKNFFCGYALLPSRFMYYEIQSKGMRNRCKI